MGKISIHSLYVEGDRDVFNMHEKHDVISIHSLYVEGDFTDFFNDMLFTISIHSLYVEGDTADKELVKGVSTFQSTPSM